MKYFLAWNHLGPINQELGDGLETEQLCRKGVGLSSCHELSPLLILILLLKHSYCFAMEATGSTIQLHIPDPGCSGLEPQDPALANDMGVW